MRHIEVTGYGTPPCNGLVLQVAAEEAPRRGLPIYGAAPSPAQTPAWRCQNCGKRWDREPLPDQAL